MTSDLVLKIHSLGLTTVPSSDNPTLPEYKRYLGELLRLETGMTVAIRFEIGSTLTEMNIEPGEKFLFCQKHFGERASVMMECMKIFREWVFNQNVGWSWSHYKATYARSKQEKLDLIKQYKEKKIKTVEDIREVLGRWDEAAGNARIPPKRDRIVHVDDLKQEEHYFIEAEFKPPVSAIAPPPVVVQSNPPEADFFATPADPAPVIGFKVEGDTVHRQELRFASPVSDIPPYLRQTPPEGLTDNGRQVIGAVCAMECDVPEVIYVRCVVPKGMTVTEDQLLTVAIVRCQLP